MTVYELIQQLSRYPSNTQLYFGLMNEYSGDSTTLYPFFIDGAGPVFRRSGPTKKDIFGAFIALNTQECILKMPLSVDYNKTSDLDILKGMVKLEGIKGKVELEG